MKKTNEPAKQARTVLSEQKKTAPQNDQRNERDTASHSSDSRAEKSRGHESKSSMTHSKHK